MHSQQKNARTRRKRVGRSSPTRSRYTRPAICLFLCHFNNITFVSLCQARRFAVLNPPSRRATHAANDDRVFDGATIEQQHHRRAALLAAHRNFFSAHLANTGDPTKQPKRDSSADGNQRQRHHEAESDTYKPRTEWGIRRRLIIFRHSITIK